MALFGSGAGGVCGDEVSSAAGAAALCYVQLPEYRVCGVGGDGNNESGLEVSGAALGRGAFVSALYLSAGADDSVFRTASGGFSGLALLDLLCAIGGDCGWRGGAISQVSVSLV